MWGGCVGGYGVCAECGVVCVCGGGGLSPLHHTPEGELGEGRWGVGGWAEQALQDASQAGRQAECGGWRRVAWPAVRAWQAGVAAGGVLHERAGQPRRTYGPPRGYTGRQAAGLSQCCPMWPLRRSPARLQHVHMHAPLWLRGLRPQMLHALPHSLAGPSCRCHRPGQWLCSRS